VVLWVGKVKKVSLEFVADFAQKGSAFSEVFLGFDAFAFEAIYNAYDAASLLGFGDDYFEGVGGGGVDVTDFGDGFDFV
jgi:hypothetical protein